MPLRHDVDLREKTSFKIGGRARDFFLVQTEADLLAAVAVAEEKKIAPLIVGDMTNVLLPDEDLPYVIQLASNNSISVDDTGKLRVWAGEKMAQVAWQVGQQGWSGWENFASLPGTVGGAVWNNAHYDSSLLSDTLLQVTFYDWRTKTIMTKEKTALNFAYDSSFFQQNKTVILWAIFQLKKEVDIRLITEKSLSTAKKRKETQPLGQPSAGCFWQNPTNSEHLKKLFPQFASQEKISAGFLIDQAGLKGKQIGAARVSEKQAAFIVNAGGATSLEVKELAKLVHDVVKNKFAVDLQTEVVII